MILMDWPGWITVLLPRSFQCLMSLILTLCLRAMAHSESPRCTTYYTEPPLAGACVGL